MKWGTIKLGDVMDVKHGYAFKSKYFANTGPYVLLSPGNCHESGGLKLKGDKEKYYTGDFPDEYLLRAGDILVVMTDLINQAPILGGSFVIPEDDKYLHNQRLGLVTIHDESRIDRSFLFYLLNTEAYRGQIRGSASGATVRHTSPDRIKRCEVRVPLNVGYQSRIASILSAYDDLIENNNRRIALLEQSARLLYEEWFVRLRFPGREHTRIVDGVPRGWEKIAVSRVTSFLKRGIAPQYDDDAAGLVISQKCVRDGRLNLDLARHQSRDFGPDRQIQVGDVLVNSTGEGTLGRVAQVKAPVENCTVDTHVTIVRPARDAGLHFFGLAMLAYESQFSTMGRGATNQTELSPAQIGSISILLPPHAIMDEFESFAAPIYEQITKLTAQSQKARAARDLLLPRLMSGEVAA